MKPFTSKHCTQYLTKSSPFNQREKLKSLAEKEYEQDLRREKRMPGFAEKPEGGLQRVANKNKLEAKRKMSQPTASKTTPLNQGLILKNDKRPKEVIAAENKKIRLKREKAGLKPGSTIIKKATKELPHQKIKEIGFKPGSKVDKSTKEKMSSTKYKK